MRSDDLSEWLNSWTQGSSSSQDPHDELMDRAEQTCRVLLNLVPAAAYAVTAWNPMSGTHLHHELASDGYSRRILEYINDGYVTDNPAFKLLHTQVPRA